MTRTGSRRARGRASSIVVAVLLLAVAGLAILPFVFMVLTAIQKSSRIALAFDPAKLDFSSFGKLFTVYGFGSALVTSSIVVILACIVNNIVCSMAAFAFAKKPFPGSDKLFWIYVATMMVPGQVTLIPMFLIMREMNLLNSCLSLFLPVINAFGVFLIRQFMDGIPDEILEAARIDGASDLRIFVSIVVPLIRPVLVALTVFTFLTTWNDFLWPLVSITDTSMQTITLAAARLQGQFVTDYGLVMAGATVAFIVPLVMYIVLQRQFVQGITSSGIKG